MDLSSDIDLEVKFKTNPLGTILIITILGGGTAAGIELLKLSKEDTQAQVQQVQHAVTTGADMVKSKVQAPTVPAAPSPRSAPAREIIVLPQATTQRPGASDDVPQHGETVE